MTAHRLLLVAALAGCGAAFAQSGEPTPPRHPTTVVYKCTNADGSVVFSDTPCSEDPKKVETLDTTAALRTGSGGNQDEISASVDDSDCRDRAYKATHADATQVAESNQHIADYRKRKEDLEAQSAYTGNTADTTSLVSDLDAAIAKESEFQQKASANNESAYQAALRDCDEKLRQATLQQEQKQQQLRQQQQQQQQQAKQLPASIPELQPTPNNDGD